MSRQKNEFKDPYELIIDAIDDGAYKPGDRLVEAELGSFHFHPSCFDFHHHNCKRK